MLRNKILTCSVKTEGKAIWCSIVFASNTAFSFGPLKKDIELLEHIQRRTRKLAETRRQDR